MSLNIAELDHTCNVVRRQVEEEFRNLTVLFIVHKSGERKKTLLAKKNHILSKPSGRKTFDMLSMTQNIQEDKTEFTGLFINQSRILHFIKRKHHTAVFFINADDFIIDQNAKHQLYHLVWHSLYYYKKANASIDNSKDFKKSYIIKENQDKLRKAMHNLMADVFGAVMMEAQGHNGYIQSLNVKRSTDVLNAAKLFESESFPFPVACEACQFVYDDLKDTIDPKTKIINQIIDLASEVSSTYGKSSIEEWISFGEPAQEMAWMGYEPEQILGTAIYTSEDTQVRAIAYMIAEIIECEPDTNIQAIAYNPFIGDEINQRNHVRLAEEQFQALLENLNEKGDIGEFKREAKKQTNSLLMGIPTGWSAPALLQASYSYNSSSGQNFQALKDCYYKYWEELSWDFVKGLSDIIIEIKKSGQEANEDTLIAKLDGIDKYKTVIATIKAIKDVELSTEEKNTTGQMSQFLYDSYQSNEKEKAEKKLSDFPQDKSD